MYKERIVPTDLRTYILSAFLACLLFFSVQRAEAATLNFSFTLGADYTTSAGAYKPDGTLVKTLWSKVLYHAGTHSYTWNGKDDDGNDVPAGSYQFKIIAHNVTYVWDGAIGNTSNVQTGPTVHRAFYPIHDMAISGSDGFYVTGYNEGQFAYNRFATSNPQVVTAKWRFVYNSTFNNVESSVSNIFDRSWSFSATDGNWVYFGVPAGADPATNAEPYKGFVTATKVSDNAQAYFTHGTQIQIGPAGQQPVPNGIYVGTQSGLSGLAVQKTGDLLAASVAPDNKVYLFDKTSGDAAGEISVVAPRKVDFAPNGDLWVLSGTSAVRYTLTGSPGVWTVATTITGFSNPLDVAVDPANNDIVMVADGGSSQQVKAYNRTGTSQWTYGTAGGYAINGATVANNKFWFNNGEGEGTFISITSDGSFWVGDGGNNRSLHFSSSRSYIDQIAYSQHSYTSCADRNDPTRVFDEFLEYSVDYSQPAGASWTLVKNWGAGLPASYFNGFGRGLKQVVTLSNGRTYGIALDTTPYKYQLLELNGNTTRIIGDFGQTGVVTTLQPNGDLISNAVTNPSWSRQALTGFDGAHNPVWATGTSLASASNGSTDPAPRCCGMGDILTPVTSSNVVVSYDQSKNDGFHLGGVSVGGTSWLWRAMPAANSIDFTNKASLVGAYDIGDGITYAGNTVATSGRNIVAGFHGEFYQSAGQANQYIHYYDNGLFVGQFGETGIGHSNYEGVIAGFAGNGVSPQLVNTNGETYFWINDESGHGPQRWHVVGTNSIQTWSGSGTLGGSAVTITPVVGGFPTDVSVLAGDAQASVSWTAVAGASSYKVKYSTTNGGPYTAVNGITGTNHVVPGLTNGIPYYFVVSAVAGGVESVNSDQVSTTPFDTSIVVQTAGQQSTPATSYPYNINSSALATGQPALNIVTPGTLSITDVGRKGYKVFDYGGVGTDSTNLHSSFTVTRGANWTDGQYHHAMKVDGVDGTDRALVPNTSASIDITVSDTNFHYLTVFSPVAFNYPRNYTVKLTPQGLSSPVAQYVITPATGLGFNNIFQFRFKGNVTLTCLGNPASDIASIQAVFLDDMVYYNPGGTAPSAPTGLTVTAGDTQIGLSWTAASGATSYSIFRGTSAGGESTTAIATGVTGTSYTNNGLTNGATYYYKIKAVNGSGSSGYSNEDSATPAAAPTAPAAPTGLSATAGDTQIALSWAASSGATSYSIFRGTSAGGESTTAIATGITATTYINTGLTNGTAYYYKVKAVNSVGSSGYSNEDSATPAASTGGLVIGNGSFETPATSTYVYNPTGGSWTFADSAGIQHNGSAWGVDNAPEGTQTAFIQNSGSISQSVGSFAIGSYTLSFKAARRANQVQPLKFTVDGTQVGSYLTPSGNNFGLLTSDAFNITTTGSHTIKLEATDSSGDSSTMVDDVQITLVTPSAPAAPTGLNATAGNTQIVLNWTATSGATSYNIYRGTTVGGESTTAIATAITGTTYTNTGLTNSTTYYYKIKAVNSAGSSSYSNEASATPATGGSGSITREYWTGVSGVAVADIPVGTTPSGTDTLTSLEGPTNWADNYGDRIRGTITAPTTGSYTFWISGDDGCEVWLSTDDQAANKVKIAYVSTYTGYHSWNDNGAQKSAAISLTAGHSYYVEVLHKEGGGDDSVSVGWLKPGETGTVPSEVVPGSVLSPYTVTAPSAPTGLTATAGNAQIVLNWTATSGATSYNVYRGTTAGGESTTAIATGVTATTYTNTGLTNGTAYYYKIKAVNAGGTSGYSNEANATPAVPNTAFITGKTLGTIRTFTGWMGMQITVGSSPLTVTQLGRYVVSGNTNTHTVKLVEASTGTDISGGSVSVDTSGATAGQFKYVALVSPITLSANTTYYVASQEDGSDQLYDADTSIVTTSVATSDTGVWNTGSWHNGGSGPNTSYGPVDFKY